MELSKLSREALEAMVQAHLANNTVTKLTCKVTTPKMQPSGKMSAGGAVSVYGLGKWPVTLYQSQWARLFDNIEHVKAFIEANQSILSVKS